MNKYIKTDIEQGLQYLKTGIMNALVALENGEEEDIILGSHVPFSLVVECAKNRGWIADDYNNSDMTNGWQVDCWYYMWTPNKIKYICIESCLWQGQKTELRVIEET